MSETKDKFTKELRQMIIQHISEAQETNEADTSLSSLSFQSTAYPDRHIWVDVEMDEIRLDLEDRAIEDVWDNAVARIKTGSLDEAIELVKLWVSGADLANHYDGLNKTYQDVHKKVKVA